MGEGKMKTLYIRYRVKPLFVIFDIRAL